MFKRFVSIFICLLTVFCLPLSASADTVDLSSSLKIDGSGYTDFSFLNDKNERKRYTSSGSAVINLRSDTEIHSLYIIFGRVFGEYTLTNPESGKTVTVGKNGFLHEYIDITALFGGPLKSIVITFNDKAVSLCEIFAFADGALPDFVQKWNIAEDGKTDLMLFATHSDDDQLYFAGLLPHYAVDKGYNVQVVYLTDHKESRNPRMNEVLNGLWAVGIKNYPVFGEFADFRIDNKEQTYKRYEELGTTYDELLGFVTEQIRRFKPLVTVGHDFSGEYGHGMHMVYADLVAKAIFTANDSTAFADTADKYGTYMVQKAYFHLYKENPIVLDFDTPKECFGGLSAFGVTQKYGFPCHISQQEEFKDWLYGNKVKVTKATQIVKYNPAKYGLFHSTVGEDTEKNDMFENVIFRETEITKQPITPQDTEPTDNTADTDKPDNSVLIIVLISAVSLVLLVVGFMIIKKKGNKNNE